MRRTSFSDSFYHGKGTCIVLPGSDGIPEWIVDRRNSYSLSIGLPQNWHQSNELLGFAIFCVYVPFDDESAHRLVGSFWKNEPNYRHSCSLRCSLLMGDGEGPVDHPLFESNCYCYKEDKDRYNESVSGQTLVVFYSKAVIGDQFRSDKWTNIRTTFEGFHNHYEKALKVKECGVRLIYSQDLQQSHPLTMQAEDTNIRICIACQRDGMLPRTCCFKGSDMNEVPIIKNPSEVDRLCLWNCKNLTSLPSNLCDFKSLATLSCSGCSQLERFPEIRQNMESLRKLNLNGTAIKKIPSSIQRLRGLQDLSLHNCKNLVNLPESICNLASLEILTVIRCPKFKKLPDNLGRLQSLEHLFVSHLHSRKFQLPSLSGLCSLRTLELHACNLREIPTEICQLSSLKALVLKGNPFSCIPDGIKQLYKLNNLDLSYCKMLQHIPQLPPRLTLLNAHHCTSLENSNIVKCFKDQIQVWFYYSI